MMYPLSRILPIRYLLVAVVIVIVIVLGIIIWFGNRSYYTIWLSLLKYERSKTWFTALMNHALTSDHPPGSICVHWTAGSSRVTSRPSPVASLLGLLRRSLPPSLPPWWWWIKVEADVDVPRVRPGRVQPAVSLTAHCGSSSGFSL